MHITHMYYYRQQHYLTRNLQTGVLQKQGVLYNKVCRDNQLSISHFPYHLCTHDCELFLKLN